MKFDICLMNPPYATKSNNMHLKFVDRINDISNKQVSIFPILFVKNHGIKSQDIYKEKFSKYLSEVEEVPSSLFTGTRMHNCGIYVFNKYKKENNISVKTLNSDIKNVKSLLDISEFTNYELEFIKYLESGDSIKVCYGFGGYDRHWRDIQKTMSINDFRNWLNNNIDKSLEEVKHNYINNSYLITNLYNGSMNGKYMTSKTGQIFNSYNDLLNFFRNIKPCYKILILKSNKEAKNCKIALQNPLFRFILYKTQVDRHIHDKRTYKYIPAIDWEDERCLTDEGLLEMCGCPKDKCKEYAEYCKKIIDNVDRKK